MDNLWNKLIQRRHSWLILLVMTQPCSDFTFVHNITLIAVHMERQDYTSVYSTLWYDAQSRIDRDAISCLHSCNGECTAIRVTLCTNSGLKWQMKNSRNNRHKQISSFKFWFRSHGLTKYVYINNDLCVTWHIHI